MKKILLVLAAALAGLLQAQVTLPHVEAQREGPEATLRYLRRHLEASNNAFTSEAIVEDFDGDGDPDVIVFNFGFSEFYLNEGNGLFQRAERRLPDSAVGGLTAENVDNDGDIDLVSSSGLLFENSGTGYFTGRNNAVPTVHGSIALGDLDGDNDLDGLARLGASLVLLRNDGTGRFTAEVGLAMSIFPNTYTLGDVDGDSDLDAFVPSSSGAVLFLNDGNGGFTDGSAGLPPQTQRTNAIALADLDGDLDLDAVLANDGANVFLIGQGNGVFLFSTAGVAAQSLDSQDVVLVDVDGDTDFDVFFANYALPGGMPAFLGEFDRLLLNQGNGTFVEGSAGLPALQDPSKTVSVGDVDGDGDVDLFVKSSELRLLLGDGAGTFRHEDGGIPARWGRSNDVTLVRIDADPHLDAVVVGGNLAGEPETSRIYMGDGTGRFTDATSRLGLVSPAAQDVAAGDVDGDGDVDLVFAISSDGDFYTSIQDNRLYLNDGSGNFTDATSSRLPTYFGDDRGLTQAVSLADMDGDQDLDILLANLHDYDGGGGGITFYRNDGAGIFAEATGVGTGLVQNGVRSLDAVDIDGDGDLDIVAVLELQGLTLIENNAGVFTDVGSRLPAAYGYFHDLYWSVVGDLDGDGDVDLAGAGSRSAGGPSEQFHFLFLGDGAGFFSDATWRLPRAVIGREGYELVDLDSDNDLDLVGHTKVIENSGNARFVDRGQAVLGPAGIRNAAYADLDNDGDIDAFWAGTEQDAVGSNTTRHLAARGIVRIGKPLTFEVFGPAQEAWFLATSPTRVFLPTQLGVIQIDPTTLTVTAVGLAGDDGRGTWTTSVPPSPALVGTDLFWQAAVGAPLRVTNPEVTRFTNF